MGLAKGINTNKVKELEAISEKINKTKLKFGDVMVPIIVLIVLIVLSIFVFVPMINAALDNQTEIKETEKKIETLESVSEKLNMIDENKLSDDIILAKSVIPKVLKVTDFIYYVDNLAKEKGLVIRELSAGDMGGNVSGENSGAGVSGPVAYQGDYQSVVSFLEQVQVISPYIIRLQDVEVVSLSNGQWSISLNVSGYYMADRNSVVDLYKPFKSYTDFQDILDIFKAKAESL